MQEGRRVLFHNERQIAALLFWDEPHAVDLFALIIQVDWPTGAVHELLVTDNLPNYNVNYSILGESSKKYLRGPAVLSLMILFTSSGLLMAAVSVPLILHRIGPNPLYGFRVRKTLEDPAVWYPVSAYAAKRLLAVGLGISISASLLFLGSCSFSDVGVPNESEFFAEFVKTGAAARASV
jgi:hypothetical protein